jgi:hypothetical protein
MKSHLFLLITLLSGQLAAQSEIFPSNAVHAAPEVFNAACGIGSNKMAAFRTFPALIRTGIRGYPAK